MDDSSADTPSDYNKIALAAARQQLLTAADVAAMGYADIAALAGVTIEKNGNSPADFFYVAVRRKVINVLEPEEAEAAEVAMKTAIEAKLTEDELAWVDDKLVKLSLDTIAATVEASR